MLGTERKGELAQPCPTPVGMGCFLTVCLLTLYWAGRWSWQQTVLHSCPCYWLKIRIVSEFSTILYNYLWKILEQSRSVLVALENCHVLFSTPITLNTHRLPYVLLQFLFIGVAHLLHRKILNMPILQMRHWSLERVNNLPKLTELVNGSVGPCVMTHCLSRIEWLIPQGVSVKVKVTQSCLALYNSMDYTYNPWNSPEYWSG